MYITLGNIITNWTDFQLISKNNSFRLHFLHAIRDEKMCFLQDARNYEEV